MLRLFGHQMVQTSDTEITEFLTNSYKITRFNLTFYYQDLSSITSLFSQRISIVNCIEWAIQLRGLRVLRLWP